MINPKYEQEIDAIIQADNRYRAGAYYFVADAVAFTTKKHVAKADDSGVRHISGGELLEGIRQFAIEQYGPLALDVLEDWGVKSTEDFGNIVFNLVEHRLLGASDDDSVDDFANGYDFRQAFLRPFATPSEADDALPPKIA